MHGQVIHGLARESGGVIIFIFLDVFVFIHTFYSFKHAGSIKAAPELCSYAQTRYSWLGGGNRAVIIFKLL